MILVHFSSSGRDPALDIKVRMHAVPSEGADLHAADGTLYSVHRVAWYPNGDEDSGTNEPFVYVVLR